MALNHEYGFNSHKYAANHTDVTHIQSTDSLIACEVCTAVGHDVIGSYKEDYSLKNLETEDTKDMGQWSSNFLLSLMTGLLEINLGKISVKSEIFPSRKSISNIVCKMKMILF